VDPEAGPGGAPGEDAAEGDSSATAAAAPAQLVDDMVKSLEAAVRHLRTNVAAVDGKVAQLNPPGEGEGEGDSSSPG
jgi:hypothetical protein